jgi:hypothetical protein
MKLSEIIIGFVVNIIAGVILYFFLPIFVNHPENWLLLVGTVIITTLITLLGFTLHKLKVLRRIGIFDVALSMTEGKGSTESILKTVNDDFSFMGIAANKWIRTGPLLEETIKKVCARNNRSRFLLLNPDSSEARRLSQLQHGDSNYTPRLIMESLHSLKVLHEMGCNVDVKLYSFLPIFRLAIIDENIIYLGYYRSRGAGQDSPQLLLSREDRTSYFQPFREYFEDIWNNFSIDLDWAQII